MLKIVVDTNILVSATIIKGKQYELLKLAKLDKIKIILSKEIIKEFREVISREKFGFSEEQIETATKNIIDISNIVIPQKKINVIEEDPDDNAILECATECKADFIISGDRHLLALKSFNDIKIVSTTQFFDMIKISNH